MPALPPFPRSPILRWAALLLVSAGLAYLLTLAAFPAALLLGPMLAAIAFGAAGAGLGLPRPLFLAAQTMVGCLVAHAITAEFLASLRSNGLVILAAVLVTVAVSAGVGWVLTRAQVLPGTSAAWGSAPGGAAAMVAMSEEHGADPRLVAFMQYVRVASVVLAASLVARLLVGEASPVPQAAQEETSFVSVLATLGVAALGAGLARLLRLPSGALVGPMLLGAVLHATGLARMHVPAPLLDAAYAGIGWYVGLRFTRDTLARTLSALPGVLAATFGIIALCGLWAWGLTFLLRIDFLTAFLATSPGGLDSVAIIAVGTQADVSFVLSVQTLRLLTVLATGPVLARWIAKAAPEAPAPEPPAPDPDAR